MTSTDLMDGPPQAFHALTSRDNSDKRGFYETTNDAFYDARRMQHKESNDNYDLLRMTKQEQKFGAMKDFVEKRSKAPKSFRERMLDKPQRVLRIVTRKASESAATGDTSNQLSQPVEEYRNRRKSCYDRPVTFMENLIKF